MSKKKSKLRKTGEKDTIRLKFHEYSYSCSDGCCHNYGTITTVNGVDLEAHNQDPQTIVRGVLEQLGFKVEIEETTNFD